MKDITLVAGLNELNVAMTPTVVGVAKFVYVSDVRQSSTPYQLLVVRTVSVDIKNVGTAAGTVHAVGSIYNMDLGTKTLAPGETATFSTTLTLNADDPWPPFVITSEAGSISSTYGQKLYLVSWDLPAKIGSGTQYWASVTVHLPYQENTKFVVTALLVPPYNNQPGWYGVPSTQAVYAELVSTPGIPDWNKSPIVYNSEKDYVVKGCYYSDVGGAPQTQHPAIASYQGYNPETGGGPYGTYSLPVGQYAVRVVVQEYEMSPDGEESGGYIVLDQIFAKVEIVSALASGLMGFGYSPQSLPLATGGVVTCKVTVFNGNSFPVTWTVEYGSVLGTQKKTVSLNPYSFAERLTWTVIVPPNYAYWTLTVFARLIELNQTVSGMVVLY